MRTGRRQTHQKVAALFVCFFALLTAPLLWAGPAIEDIAFTTKPSGGLEIKLQFDGAAPEPKAYSIAKPARLIFDMPTVTSKLENKRHTLAMGNTESVMILEAGDRTRAIVNLKQMTPYQMHTQGNDLYITLGEADSAEYLTRPRDSMMAKAVSQKSSNTVHNASIRNIDFKRGEDGSGMLMLDLSDKFIDVDVSVEGSNLKINFHNMMVPQNLQRNYDVLDFATPVSGFDIKQRSDSVSVDLRAEGEFDYLAYQTDQQYVISIKPLSAEEADEKRKEFAYAGDSLSLNFQDIQVRSVLQLIADFTDLNMVASDTVQGNITLRLQNVPWDQALDLVLKTKGLDKRVEGNVILVGPADEIAERERKEIENNKQREELAPLRSEVFKIRYADAKDLYNIFMGNMEEIVGSSKSSQSSGGQQDKGQENQRMLSDRGSVLVDVRTNALVVTEIASKLDEIRRFIELLDVPVRQVMIEARIVKASSDFSEKLGVQWGGVGYSNNGKLRSGGSLNSVVGLGENIAEGGGLIANYPDALAVDLGITDTGASKFSIGYADAGMLLNLELSALETGGHGEVVSQPKVITGDKQKAMISSGVKIPYQTRQTGSSEGAGNQQATITLEEAVLKLEVTPKITPDNRIIMSLVITQDALAGLASNDQPLIDTTQLETQVLVSNGETIVLGGVFQTEEISGTSKTPLLGDIPVVGNLFKRTTQTSSKTETLIFITPSIIADAIR